MEVKRATFEQVQKAQNELIFSEDGIDKLAEKKETIASESRSVFFDRLALALLGKELDYPYILEYKGGRYNMGSVAVFARKMAYFEDTDDKCQEVPLKNQKVRVSIDLLWIALRESIYKPMAEALTLAMKSSAEIFRGGGDSFVASPEDKINE